MSSFSTIEGAELKATAAAAADAATEKAAEVKDAAEKTVDEIKPQVNEAVQEVKEAGRFLSLEKVRLTERHLMQKWECSVWNNNDLCIRSNSFRTTKRSSLVDHSRDTVYFWSNDSPRLTVYSPCTSKERRKKSIVSSGKQGRSSCAFSLGAELAGAAAQKVDEAKDAGAQLAADAKDAAEKKVDEIKPAVEEKLEQAKETAAEVAGEAAEKAEEAKATILETAVHAKDAVVEKAQEIGHAVRRAWPRMFLTARTSL